MNDTLWEGEGEGVVLGSVVDWISETRSAGALMS